MCCVRFVPARAYLIARPGRPIERCDKLSHVRVRIRKGCLDLCHWLRRFGLRRQRGGVSERVQRSPSVHPTAKESAATIVSNWGVDRYRIVLAAILAFALIGVWVTGTLLIDSAGGWRTEREGNAHLLRLCESRSLPGVSCAGVVGSRWGSFDVYVGSRRVLVPTSLIGLVYFVSVVLWFGMLGRIPADARWLWLLTMSAVTCGLAGSVVFTALMALALSQWCPLCVIAHVLNGGIFLGTAWLWLAARRAAAHPAQSGSYPVRIRQPIGRLAAWAMLGAGVAAAGLWFYFDAMTEVRRQWRKAAGLNQALATLRNDQGLVMREYLAQPVVDIPGYRDSDGESGLSGARSDPELIIFMDYDCKASACFEKQRPALIDCAFGGDIHISYRHLPTRHVGVDGNGDSRAGQPVPAAAHVSWASLAAEAARLQGGERSFAAMHRLLFEYRSDPGGRDYTTLARLAGLDVERFLADLSSDEALRRVRGDVALAANLGVTGAPTVFLSGRRVPDLCAGSRVFWNAVAGELSAERAATTDAAEFASR